METCEQCGEEFQHIGKHWSQSSTCSYPPLTQRQYEICIGLLMGDGCIGNKNCKNQCMQTNMITEEYLEYLNEIFEKFGTYVYLVKTAEELAQRNRDSGFQEDARAKNYSDQFHWRTISHPIISELTSWYDTGKKVWPNDIELTPTVLKHWFVGDGSFNDNQTSKYIQISLANEADNEDKVGSYFKNVGLPRPNRWHTYERKRGDGSVSCDAVWNKSESEELWEYMLSDGHGIPPGFEYKWPVEYHDDHTITIDDLDSAETAVA